MNSTPLLKQAGQVYTPKMFEAFQDEYDWSTTAYIKPSQSKNQYVVVISDLGDVPLVEMQCTVFGDSITQTAACSCKLFERLGILCAHALKVLNAMNIKLIHEKVVVVEDPQLNTTRRYRSLCRKLVSLAFRAANFKESSLFLENKLNTMISEVDKRLSNMQLEECTNLVLDLNKSVQLEDPTILCNVVLKKKNGRKGGRRLRRWNEKLHMKKRKNLVDGLEDQPTRKNQSKKKKQGQNIETQSMQVCRLEKVRVERRCTL
ncbi:hypothetical protein V2J09_004216 [Rumex salicifolius]